MISTDLCDKKKFTENLMSQTCPAILFGGIKKGFLAWKPLILLVPTQGVEPWTY